MLRSVIFVLCAVTVSSLWAKDEKAPKSVTIKVMGTTDKDKAPSVSLSQALVFAFDKDGEEKSRAKFGAPKFRWITLHQGQMDVKLDFLVEEKAAKIAIAPWAVAPVAKEQVQIRNQKWNIVYWWDLGGQKREVLWKGEINIKGEKLSTEVEALSLKKLPTEAAAGKWLSFSMTGEARSWAQLKVFSIESDPLGEEKAAQIGQFDLELASGKKPFQVLTRMAPSTKIDIHSESGKRISQIKAKK